MYFRENERVGASRGYGEYTSYQEAPLGMAIALPAVGIGAAIVALLEALAFVATAIAAAWLLIKAYQKAKRLGFGAETIGQQLILAMTRVVTQANRIIAEIQRLLREATQRQQPPECERFLQFMRERLARIQEAVRRYIAEPTNIRDPQSPAKVELLRVLEGSLEGIGPMIKLLRQCVRV